VVKHVDRYFSEIRGGASDLRTIGNEPLALGGFFRLITLRNPR
jgi:hypothetical protein